MTLLEMIKACTKCGESKPLTEYYLTRSVYGERWSSNCKACHNKSPSRKPYLCPASRVVCGQRCYLRHQCAAEPVRIQALTERLNGQTERAMVEYVQRLRRA